jgi:hypothetical protein
MVVGSNGMTPSGSSTDISNLLYSNISENQFAGLHNFSQISVLNTSDFVLQRQDINTSGYDNRLLLESVTDYELLLKSHTTSNDSVKIFQTGAEDVTGENITRVNTSWTELIKNDTLAFIIWNVTKKHAGFNTTDESVEKCLNEFNDKIGAIAAYFVSATVRENGYFLRDFVNQISKYSHLHDLRTVKKFYDKFKDILEGHRLYYTALKKVIQNMNQEIKFMIFCAQRRFCSCFSLHDVVRYEEQLSSLPKYNFLLKAYLIFGYYIDPIIRSIFIVTGLILNCTILTILAKHKYIISTCDFMVMNITVNAILILIVYVPLQYIHTYYSSILPHEESAYNNVFVAVQTLLISVSAMSLLALRAQHRTKAVISSSPISTVWRSVFCGLSVWLVSFSVAAFIYAFNGYQKIGNAFVPLIYFVLYVLILPTAMKIFKRNTKNVPVNSEEEDVITSKTITELSKAFRVTHIPLFLWLLFEGVCGFIFRLVSINYAYVEVVFFYVYISYTCVNTLALCRGSSVFRKLLYDRLFRCWHILNEQQSVTTKETRLSDVTQSSP